MTTTISITGGHNQVLLDLINEIPTEDCAAGRGYCQSATARVFGSPNRCYGDTSRNILRTLVVDRRPGSPYRMSHITLDARLVTVEQERLMKFLLQPAGHPYGGASVSLLRRLIWACR